MQKAEKALIGPKEAARLLETNGHFVNRKIKQTVVMRYAHDMKHGRWLENGCTLQFDPDGVLLDGQHRLWAVIESGVSIWFWMITGVSASAITAVDIGVDRKLSDFLQMTGQTSCICRSSIIRQVWRWDHRQTFSKSPGVIDDIPTIQQALAFYADHQAEITNAISHVDAKQGIRVLGKRSLLTTLFLIFSRINEDDAIGFFHELETGANLAIGSPSLALRKRMLEDRANRAHLNDYVVAALAIKAWNAYREGRKINVLSWRSGGANPEIFPVPA